MTANDHYEYIASITAGHKGYSPSGTIFRQHMTTGKVEQLAMRMSSGATAWHDQTLNELALAKEYAVGGVPALHTDKFSEAMAHVIEELIKVGEVAMAMRWVRFI